MGGRAVEFTPQGLSVVASTPADNREREEAPEPPAPPRKQQKKVETEQVSPKDVIRLARKRLRDIKRELKRMRQLERERDQLQRLLDAADDKRPASVRPLKRHAG